MDNKFESFAYKYYEFLKYLDDFIEERKVQTTNRVLMSNDFEIQRYIKEEKLSPIVKGYNELKDYINLDGPATFQMLKDFTQFLTIANEVFMYPNDKEDHFYAFQSAGGKDKKNLALQVTPLGLLVKYLFTFKETNLSVPDDDYNFLTSFVDKKEEPMVELVEMQVDRKIIGGSNTTMNFITIYGIEDHLDTKKDKVLASIVFSTTKNMISDCLDDILSNYIAKCALRDNLNIGDVINNDLRLRRDSI